MMQGVSLRSDLQLALPARTAPTARPADGPRFEPPRAAAAGQDFIDVEVLWEEADPAPDVTWRRTPAPRPVHPPLRVVSPGAALAAYRTASSTAALPHTLVDLFA